MRKIEKLLIATHNKGKLKEFKALLGAFIPKIVSAGDLNLDEPEETGTTFYENALLKARTAAKVSGFPALADDSGLCVNVLNGQPGIYSARWAGEPRDFDMAMKRIHDALGEAQDRSAYFICSLVLCWPDGEFLSVEGRCDGTLVWPPRLGGHGHGYDPMFQPTGNTRTFSEMEDVEKDAQSHRGEALNKLKALFDEA